MARRESALEITAAASEWVVRLDRGLSPVEQEELNLWAEADPRRAGALARAQALWVQADRARIFATSTPDAIDRPAVRRTRVSPRWAWAASVLLTVAASFYGWHDYSATHLSTEVGEIRRLPLPDGSSITLNTHSRIRVAYSENLRLIRLDRGEALFDVAHDSTRPFIVEAGPLRVRAVGTEFVVRRDDLMDAQVTVARGVVDVWRQTAVPEPAMRLAAGLRTVATQRRVEPAENISEAELARSIAWQDGILDLEGRTLAAAAAEFNRYNHDRVVVEDPVLAGQHVVGRFHTNDPKGFAVAAAAMLDGQVRVESDRIVLGRRGTQ